MIISPILPPGLTRGTAVGGGVGVGVGVGVAHPITNIARVIANNASRICRVFMVYLLYAD
jgi:hypothetical protein